MCRVHKEKAIIILKFFVFFFLFLYYFIVNNLCGKKIKKKKKEKLSEIDVIEVDEIKTRAGKQGTHSQGFRENITV